MKDSNLSDEQNIQYNILKITIQNENSSENQELNQSQQNTRNNQNGLTGRLITDIVLKLLGYVAERERDNIKYND